MMRIISKKLIQRLNTIHTPKISVRPSILLMLTMFIMLTIYPGMVLAAAEEISIAEAIDMVWVLIATFLVFLMHAGFAMVETGFTRAKNAGNIIMKNFMTICGGSLSYWLIGFSIMFGGTAAGFIGVGALAVGGDWSALGLDFPVHVFFIFQAVFAATAATIVSGAVVERIKYPAYLIFSLVITAFIYPVVGHWIWGDGWLAELGFVDFAGSTVVHLTGGCAAMVGAFMVGPRLGKYGPDGRVNALPGHNITMGALGVLILWFGWFGFNGGSTLTAFDPGLGTVIVNTNIAAAAGGVFAMFATWYLYKKPDVSITLNGALAGLVSITAGAYDVAPVGAFIMGSLGGILVTASISFFDRVLRIDDPVGAISVHGSCGILGTIMVGFFALDGGLFYGGGAALLGIQVVGVLAVMAWVAVTSALVFSILKAAIGIRVSRAHELRGLDYEEHGMEAYADFVPR